MLIKIRYPNAVSHDFPCSNVLNCKWVWEDSIIISTELRGKDNFQECPVTEAFRMNQSSTWLYKRYLELLCIDFQILELLITSSNAIFPKLVCILNEISLELRNIIVNYQLVSLKISNHRITNMFFRILHLIQITGISKQMHRRRLSFSLYISKTESIKEQTDLQSHVLLWQSFINK